MVIEKDTHSISIVTTHISNGCREHNTTSITFLQWSCYIIHYVLLRLFYYEPVINFIASIFILEEYISSIYIDIV